MSKPILGKRILEAGLPSELLKVADLYTSK